jgi:predicted nucleic acid-binding Zn ribbon protein
MEIPKHRHCLNCGISIPPDQVFCSEKCRIEYMQRRKRMLRTQYMFLAIAGLIILYYIITIVWKM